MDTCLNLGLGGVGARCSGRKPPLEKVGDMSAAMLSCVTVRCVTTTDQILRNTTSLLTDCIEASCTGCYHTEALMSSWLARGVTCYSRYVGYACVTPPPTASSR